MEKEIHHYEILEKRIELLEREVLHLKKALQYKLQNKNKNKF